MNFTKLTKAVYIILYTGLLFAALSQEDTSATSKEKPDSIATLDKMVITATRTNRLMSQTPASVSVISQEEIEISPAKNIDDLIMSETGVQVKRVVGIGEGVPSDIIIRGVSGSFGASRTLILVDGIPTNASGTPYLILNEIPLEAIKSVEIVRGPFSSLYGANAFGGVVNILTQKGYGKPGFKAYFETSYPFTVLHKYTVNENSMKTSLTESGSETYWNIEGRSSGGNERVNYLVCAGFRDCGNFLLRDYAINKVGENDTFHITNENRDYRDIRFFGKCGVALGNNAEIELHSRFFHSDLGNGKTRNIKPYPVDVVMKGTKFVVGPVVKVALNENITIKGKAYYRTLIGEFWNEELFEDTADSLYYYVPGYWRSQQHDWQVESQGIFKISKAQIITSGIEYLGNFIHFGTKVNTKTDSIIPGADSTDKMISNVALYLQEEIFLFDKLNIVPGIRWDYHSDFGSALSPKFGISYKIIDWLRFRSSVGRAFRAPTLSELYMPDTQIKHDFLLTSNPDLKPEYIWAVDGAFEISPLPTFKIQLGLFYNKMKNLIVPQLDTTDLFEILQGKKDPGITHINVDSAWSRGIEFEVEWQAASWLYIFGNYILQKTKNERAEEVQRLFKDDKNLSESELGVPLDYVPNQTSDFGIRIRKGIGKLLLEGTITESFIGKRSYQEWTEIDEETCVKIIPTDEGYEFYIDPWLYDLDAYWRTDIGFKCTFNKHIWFAFNIQNLFNAVFEESGGSLAPGRFASIKIGGEL